MFPGQDTEQPAKDPALPAKIAYVLYLVSPFVGGLTWVCAVVIAYAYRGSAPVWLETHYRFQIRTFWMGLLPFIISVALCIVLIGFLPLGLLILWMMIRSARGLRLVAAGEAHPNPTSWGFG